MVRVAPHKGIIVLITIIQGLLWKKMVAILVFMSDFSGFLPATTEETGDHADIKAMIIN